MNSQTVPPPRAARSPKETRTVLIADDSSSVRASLGTLLVREGYNVLMACNGQDVFYILSRERIDLVLLDLDMPEIDGWQTLEQLQEAHPAVPVVVITGQENERHWVQKHGGRALLEKPPDIPTLLRTVADLAHCNQRGSSRSSGQRLLWNFHYSPPDKNAFRVTEIVKVL